MGFYAQVAWCSSKTVVFAVHLTSLLSKHQFAENVFFYAQDTLNSDLMRNYRFQGSLLGSPLGWPEKAIEMATF